MELAQSTDKTFSLDELAAVADVPRRTVRYYIELGLLEGAEGETRAARSAAIRCLMRDSTMPSAVSRRI